MKNIIKNERGVTLISLAVAIIVLGIITTLLLYNVKDTKDIERVSNMYIDIDGISDRISNYYSRYGALPVRRDIDLSSDSTISSWVSELESSNNEGPLGANDTGDFYVIDMNALENLSLNYGSGYAKMQGTTLPEDKDVYVINENSHNIFYLQGIRVNNNGTVKMYYTNHEKDVETVSIRYVDQIKIPDGFVFKSGDTRNNLKIEKVVAGGTNIEYTWANTADNIYTMTKTEEENVENYYLKTGETFNSKIIFDTTNGQNAEDLITSAKEFGGFYYTNGSAANTINVYYFSVTEDDNWGLTYEKEGIYTDKNGDTAYIPAGFKISKLSSLNTINKGLVIKKDVKAEQIAAGDTGDEYVWIDVPDDVLKNARTLEEIENALKEYTKDYREEGYEDTYEDGFINLTNGDSTANSKLIYNNLKNKMLQSIKQNGGFYIGRYEASKSSEDKAQSQRDKRPWNEITIGNAQIAANAGTTDNYTTSLMFGLQWDLVCKFIEETGIKTNDEITRDSTNWGNFKNSQFVITSNNSKQTDYNNWSDIAKGETKNSGGAILLTTGASDRNKALSIYDFAGNDMEWTLENALNENTKKCVARGGNGFRNSGNAGYGTNAYGTAAYEYSNTATFTDWMVGFRVTLFKTPTEISNN